MSHFAFVTTELAPYTPGGAGVLVSSLVTLLRERGDRVSVVLCSTPKEPIDDVDVVVAPATTAPGWNFSFMDASMAGAEALGRLHADDPIDLVEVQDFDGLGFWLLTHRRDLGLGDVPISIRVHGPVDLQIEAMGGSTHEFDVVAAMEHASFQMADRVVAPSAGIGRLVTERYDLDPDRVAIGSPVVRSIARGTRWVGDQSDLLVVGRLSEVKGSHDMVLAVIPVLERHQDFSVTFVGSDGWSISRSETMRTFLESLIPASIADRVLFAGHRSPAELASLMSSASVVVAPSRFETFNLAVHEARSIGAPVIVPRIPAFEGLLDASTGALVYDGSVRGLTEAMEKIVTDAAFANELSNRPVPTLGDPIAPYDPETVPVHHARSQGGLGTAALATVEQVRFDEGSIDSSQPVMGSIVRRTPAPLVRAIKPLVPRRLKDRLKKASDWDRLEAERAWDAKWREVAGALAAEPASTTRRTTFVVPCYNQGPFVRQAIVSAFDQTDSDWDMIVVDPESDDPETVSILESIDFPRVRVLRQRNRGLSASRNEAIDSTNAEYIVPLDADDELHPQFLEKLGGALRADPEAGYAHCWAELFGDVGAVWATRPVNPYQLVVSNGVVGCVLMRRDAWNAVGGYEESLVQGNEDWDLWIRLGAVGFHGVQVREPLFRYRKHGVSMSVRLESRFEETLTAHRQRLKDVYALDNIRALKQDWYPLLTVAGPGSLDAYASSAGSDVQFLECDLDGFAAVVNDVHGKYVVLLQNSTGVESKVLDQMCAILENDVSLGSVTTSAAQPIRVVRTWSLFDTAGPSRDLVIEHPASSDVSLSPHQIPRDAWMVPELMNGLPVQRQAPEVEGTIPDWIET